MELKSKWLSSSDFGFDAPPALMVVN
jgi:hypothetical protein